MPKGESCDIKSMKAYVAFCGCLGGYGQAVNYTSDFDASGGASTSSPEKEEEEEEGNMKSSIFIDVIVEAVFILGKSGKACVCVYHFELLLNYFRDEWFRFCLELLVDIIVYV